MKLSVFSALAVCAVLVLSVPADVTSASPMPEPQFGVNGFGKKGYGTGYGAKNENAANAKNFGYNKGYNKANGYAKGYGNNIAKKGVNAKGAGKKGFGNNGFGKFGGFGGKGFGGKGKGYGFI